MFVEAEFVVQIEPTEFGGFGQLDSGVIILIDGHHCPFPIPGEHDNFGLEGTDG